MIQLPQLLWPLQLLSLAVLASTTLSTTTRYITVNRYVEALCTVLDVELIYPTQPILLPTMVCIFDAEFEEYVKYHILDDCSGDMRFEFYGVENPACTGYAKKALIVKTGVCVEVEMNGGRVRYLKPKVIFDDEGEASIACSLEPPSRPSVDALVLRTSYTSTTACDAAAVPKAWPTVVWKMTDLCDLYVGDGSRMVSAGRITTIFEPSATWVKLARFLVTSSGTCIDGSVPTALPTGSPTSEPTAAPTTTNSSIPPSVAPSAAPSTHAPSSAPAVPPLNALALDFEYVRVDSALCVATSLTSSRTVVEWNVAGQSLRIDRWDTDATCAGLATATFTVYGSPGPCAVGSIGALDPTSDLFPGPLRGWSVVAVWTGSAPPLALLEEVVTTTWFASRFCETRDPNVLITSVRSGGAASCVQFEPHHRRSVSFLMPDECALGLRQRSSYCTQCSKGHYCRGGLQMQCNPGTYSNVAGSSACARCNVELFRYAPNFGTENCINCFSFPSPLADVCVVCGPGKFINRLTRTCAACPGGQYSTIVQQRNCRMCGKMRFIPPSAEGATECDYCPNATIPSLDHSVCVDRPTYAPAPMWVQGVKGILIFFAVAGAVLAVCICSIGSTVGTLFLREQLRLHHEHELHLDLKMEVELEEQMTRDEEEFMEGVVPQQQPLT